MQTLFIVVFMALLNTTNSFAAPALKTNCSNEDTFLKLNELGLNLKGERIAELFINFKDLNRILNLPEVVLQQNTTGILVSEKTESSTVILNFEEQAQEQEDKTEMNAKVSIKLEDVKVRENMNLKCGK